MKKRIVFIILGLVLCPMIATAQIGYQVSLLNNATGEPRANESVKVKIEITNSEGKVICSEEKNATSNEFGVLSLSVGNSTTFDDVDWSKAPFYVSATIDDVLIGKSQILSVPLAEAAYNLIGVSRETLEEGTWGHTETEYDEITHERYTWSIKVKFKFNDNSSGSISFTEYWSGGPDTSTYDFVINGNTIWILDDFGTYEYMIYNKGKLYSHKGVLTHQ